MKVQGVHFRTIWLKPEDAGVVQIIDQRFLPHEFVIEEIRSVAQMATAIHDMHVRGAGLIGAAAGFGMYLATLESMPLERAAELLKATRPTAVNLGWAVDRQLRSVGKSRVPGKRSCALCRPHKTSPMKMRSAAAISASMDTLARRNQRTQKWRAREHSDALQRGVAGVCGLRIGPVTRLCGARQRIGGSRLGG
jgi:hypothetical protein